MPDTPSTIPTGGLSILGLMRAQRRLTIGVVAGTTLLAVAAAFLMTPIYQTTATLIADDESNAAGLSSMLGDLGSLASFAGVNIGTDQAKIEAEALMQSRQFIESFISDHNLLPELFDRRWDADAKRWKKTWRHPDPPSLYDGYQRFSEKVLTLTENKKTGIVTVDIDWRDPEEGARWCNELVHRLNESMRQRAIREADASLELLTNELKSATQVELQQAISRGIEMYVKQRALASVRPEYAFRVIDPAKAPDLDDYEQPKRALYIACGPIVGLLLAMFVVLGLDFLKRERLDGG